MKRSPQCNQCGEDEKFAYQGNYGGTCWYTCNNCGNNEVTISDKEIED